jgi:predicted enzyme related to lactoylglutathione lyase
MAECQRLGGTVLAPPRSYGGGRYCVIEDPAGAVCALYQPPDAA